MSRKQFAAALRHRRRLSGSGSRDVFPFRHRVDLMQIGGEQSGANGAAPKGCGLRRRLKRSAAVRARIESPALLAPAFVWGRGNSRRDYSSLCGAMLDIRHDRTFGGGVGAEFVGHHALWRASLLSQKPRQQSLCSLCIAMDLEDFIEDIASLIDRAPKVTLLTVDRDD